MFVPGEKKWRAGVEKRGQPASFPRKFWKIPFLTEERHVYSAVKLNCEEAMREQSNWIPILLILFLVSLPWSLAAMQITAVVLVLAIILDSIVHHRRPFPFHPFFYFMIVYAAVRVMSALYNPTPVRSLWAVAANDWFLLVVPFLTGIRLSREWKERALHALLLSATLVGMYGVFQTFFGYEIFRGIRIPAYGHFFRAIGGYNFYLTFAGNQLLALGLALSCLLTEKSSALRWKYAGAFVVILLSILGTFARSAWLGLTAMILLGVWILNRRYFWRAVAVFVFLGGMLLLVVPDFRMRVVSIFQPAENSVRLNLWRTGWAMWKMHPVWGIGPGRFNELFPLFKVPGVYDATGHTHNDYLNMAVNSGIVGLVSWLALWMAWFWYTIRALLLFPLAAIDRKWLYGSILGVAAILIAAFFQCYFTDLENNIYWWTIAALTLMVQNEYRSLPGGSSPE